MRLTTFTDYGLRVLIFVAAHPEGRATVSQVADAFEISENHVVKVVHFLGQHGFLANTRGREGGMRLARPAEAINVGTVVRKTEGEAVPAACFSSEGSGCVISNGCRLRAVFSEAVRAFEAVLDSYTLADLVQNRTELRKMLHIATLKCSMKGTGGASDRGEQR
jgi:Rrf2 family nitric oxide-sensitive transcriptional repressor